MDTTVHYGKVPWKSGHRIIGYHSGGQALLFVITTIQNPTSTIKPFLFVAQAVRIYIHKRHPYKRVAVARPKGNKEPDEENKEAKVSKGK